MITLIHSLLKNIYSTGHEDEAKNEISSPIDLKIFALRVSNVHVITLVEQCPSEGQYFFLKVLCGSDSYGKEFKAKKYKLDKHFLSKVTRHLNLSDLILLRLLHDQAEFLQIMTHLPESVLERQVDEMFATVDTNQDGRISYQEFCVSIIRLLSRIFLNPLISLK